jgi:hypothetical protein
MRYLGKSKKTGGKQMLTERFDRFFKTDESKVKEAEKIVALLKDSPELEERRQERDKKRLARIRELLAEREQIERAYAEAIPELTANVTEAQERENRAQEALKAATQGADQRRAREIQRQF